MQTFIYLTSGLFSGFMLFLIFFLIRKHIVLRSIKNHAYYISIIQNKKYELNTENQIPATLERYYITDHIYFDYCITNHSSEVVALDLQRRLKNEILESSTITIKFF